MIYENEISNRFVHLMVINEIKILETKFEDIPDQMALIEQSICYFAKKPGFALVSQYCKDSDIHLNSLKDFAFFYTNKVSRLLFGSIPIWSADDDKLTIDYTNDPPSWFTCLGVPNRPLSRNSEAWFRYYINFIAGVLMGMLTHLGYHTFLTIDGARFEMLKFTIEAIKFQDCWEIEASNSIHF